MIVSRRERGTTIREKKESAEHKHKRRGNGEKKPERRR